MRNLWARLVSAWMDFWYGPPCEKHPGHRQHEVDLEGDGLGLFCSECWVEYQEKYGNE